MSESSLNFVAALYRNVLSREPDAQGLAHWTAAADNGGATAASLSTAFITSAEAEAVVNPLYRVYDAIFNRLADADGLSGWAGVLRGGASIKSVTDQFLASSEFSARIGGEVSNDAFVEFLYANVLNRSADAVGKAGWLNALNGGQISRADVVVGITFSQEAVDANSAATRQLNVAQAFEAIRGRLPSAAELNARLASSFDAVVNGLVSPNVSGRVADGYIKGATVFVDLDGDGKLGLGEEATTTDAQGNFTLPGGGTGKLVVTGGTDISTNKAFTGRFEAPSGSTVVNPLTTLVQKMVEKGQTVEQAQTTVATALGLPTSLDLSRYDPLNMAASSAKGSADAATAVQAQAAAAQVANLFAAAGAALTGAGAQAGSALSSSAATSAIADALAQSMMSAGAGGSFNLSSANALKDVITAAATVADLPASAQAAVLQASGATGALVAASNATVASAASAAGLDAGAIMTMMAKVQTVAQGELTDKIATNMESGGSLDALLTDYTGDKLATTVNAAEVGSVVEGYTPPADLPNMPSVVIEAPDGVTLPPAAGEEGNGGNGNGGNGNGGNGNGGGLPGGTDTTPPNAPLYQRILIAGDNVVSDAEADAVPLSALAGTAEAHATIHITVTDGTNTVNTNLQVGSDGSFSGNNVFYMGGLNNGTLTVTATVRDADGNVSPEATWTIIKGASFSVAESGGVVTFGGTADGDITVAVGVGNVATFTRGGVVASTTVDLDGVTKMTVADGQRLSMTAAHATGLTIDGDGAVTVTALEDRLDADLSRITADAVTALVDTTGSNIQNPSVIFTGNFGSAAVAVSGGGAMVVDNCEMGTATFTVDSGAILSGKHQTLSGKTVTGDGAVAIELASNTDARGFAGSLTITGLVTHHNGGTDRDISQDAHLSAIDIFHIESDPNGADLTLTLTAAQASGKTVGGSKGVVAIVGLDGTTDLSHVNSANITVTATVTESTDLTGVDLSRLDALTVNDGNDSHAITVTVSPQQYAAWKDRVTTGADDHVVSSDSAPPTVTTTQAAYDANTDILTISGTHFATLLESGENASTDIKGRLDWTKLLWDINGDGNTTADASFSLNGVASAVVTDDGTLTVTLTGGGAATLETTSGFGTTGGTDTLDIAPGFARDLSGNAATTDSLSDGALAITADNIPPTIAGVVGPANGAHKAGDHLDFVVTFSEGVVVTITNGTPRLALTVGADQKFAQYLSGSGSNSLTFRYTVESNVTDADGVAVASTLDLNGGAITDSAGNAPADLGFAAPATTGVTVDTTAPVIDAVTIPNAAMKIGDVVTVTLTVSAAGGEALTLKPGSTIGGFTLGNLTKSSDTEYTATFTIAANGTDVTADAGIPLNIVLLDPAGNESAAFTTAIMQNADAIDAHAPALQSSTPTDDATDVAVDANITLTFGETVSAGTGAIVITNLGNSNDVRTISVSDAQVSINGATVTINPSNDLAVGGQYSVTFAAGVFQDAVGNANAGMSNPSALTFSVVDLVVTKDTADIQAAFNAYTGTTATVVADGMTPQQLIHVANGANKIKANGVTGTLALTNNLDGSKIEALLNKTADGATVTVNADNFGPSHLEAIAAHIAKVDQITHLTLDQNSGAADDLATVLAANAVGDASVTVNGTGMSASQLAAIADHIGKVASTLSGDLTLSEALTAQQITALIGEQPATHHNYASVGDMSGDQLTAILTDKANVDATVASGKTLTLSADDFGAGFRTLTGDGNVTITGLGAQAFDGTDIGVNGARLALVPATVTLNTNTNLSGLDVQVATGQVLTVSSTQAAYAHSFTGAGGLTVSSFSMSSNLDISGINVDGAITFPSIVVPEAYVLTLSSKAAVGANITGTGGLTVTGSAGDQTFTVATTGVNSITPGAGLDTVTLGNGADTVSIALGAGVGASDSAPGYGAAHTIDTISGLSVGQDHLALSGGVDLLGNGVYSFDNGATLILVEKGIVTATTQTDGNMLISELLAALQNTTHSVAFFANESKSEAYVLQGNGVQGGDIGDIVVHLVGITGTLNDLSAILA